MFEKGLHSFEGNEYLGIGFVLLSDISQNTDISQEQRLYNIRRFNFSVIIDQNNNYQKIQGIREALEFVISQDVEYTPPAATVDAIIN